MSFHIGKSQLTNLQNGTAIGILFGTTVGLHAPQHALGDDSACSHQAFSLCLKQRQPCFIGFH